MDSTIPWDAKGDEGRLSLIWSFHDLEVQEQFLVILMDIATETFGNMSSRCDVIPRWSLPFKFVDISNHCTPSSALAQGMAD